jgi:hypothetical protein
MSLYESTQNTLATLDDKSAYRIFEGSLVLSELASQESLRFKYRLYQSKTPINRLIVLTPNIEGVTILERRLAHRLAKEGFHVLVPFARAEQFPFDEETSAKIERTFERAMAASLYMIEEIKSAVAFDSEQMGLAGASQGGIRSATLYGLDHRFKAIFIAVAGADLPSLYVETEIDQLVEFREAHMEGVDIVNLNEYEDYLRKTLRLDPFLIIENPRLDGIAMIIAQEDDIVPTSNQWKLWSAIKNAGVHPKTFIKDVTHVTGALMLIRYEGVMVPWFLEKLNTRP